MKIETCFGVLPYGGDWGVFRLNSAKPDFSDANKEVAVSWALQNLDFSEPRAVRVCDAQSKKITEYIGWPADKCPTIAELQQCQELLNRIKFTAAGEQ